MFEAADGLAFIIGAAGGGLGAVWCRTGPKWVEVGQGGPHLQMFYVVLLWMDNGLFRLVRREDRGAIDWGRVKRYQVLQ